MNIPVRLIRFWLSRVMVAAVFPFALVASAVTLRVRAKLVRRIGLITTCYIGLFLTTVAGATPLVYDESVDGDIDSFTAELHFDVGVNIVTGNETAAADPPFDLDFDAFDLTLPAGTALTAVELVISAITVLGNPIEISINPNIQEIGGGPLLADVVSGGFSLVLNGLPAFDLPSTFQFQGQFPLNEGTYRFGVGSGINAGPSGASWDYEYRFTVVPEPSTALLLILGLVALTTKRKPLNYS